MYCPVCQAQDTRVIDSRLVDAGARVRRRRECIECGERFTSYEVAELSMPNIVKSTGVREAFSEEKLRSGILRALEKRPVSIDDIEMALNRIMRKLRSTGEREVKAQLVGETVMNELINIDQVAYIRFASVYRSFENIEAFKEEIRRIHTKKKNDNR